MKFLANQHPVKNYKDFDDAASEVHFMCTIHVTELEGLFPDFGNDVFDHKFIQSRGLKNGYRQIFDPLLPVTVGAFEPSDMIYESNRPAHQPATGYRIFNGSKTDRKAFVSNPGKFSLGKEIPIGSRFSLGINDIRIWILYNWVRDFVMNDLEGNFDDSDFTIPSMSEFVPIFRTPLAPDQNLDYHFLSRKALYDMVGPHKKAMEQLKGWLTDRNELRLISVRLLNGGIYICGGADVRILAYHAMKEGINPPCLSNLMS